jgi:hypothetical protein
MSMGSLLRESWNAWAVPWKLPVTDPGQRHLVDRIDGVAQGRARREIEGQRHRGELALMAHRQVADLVRVIVHEGRHRHLLPGDGRLDVELVERVRIGLQPGRDLQDHVVTVELREVLRHLPLSEGVVERLVDQRRLYAEARGLVAVDDQRQRRAAVLLVGSGVAQQWQLLHLLEKLRRPLVELLEAGVLEGVLILCASLSPAHADVLPRLHKQRAAADLRKLRAQPRNDLIGAR